MTGSPFFITASDYMPNPIGHWPFEETSGTDVPDISGNGYHGICYDGSNTVGNGPTWTTDATRGQCLSFDGVSDFVGCANFALTSAFTVMAWVYPKVTGSIKTICAKRNGGQGSINDSTNTQFIYTLSSGLTPTLAIYESNTVTQSLTGTSQLTVNTWYHVAATYAGNGPLSRGYINGSPSGTRNFSINLNQTAQLHFQIGCRNGNNNTRYFDGLIDDVRVFDFALSTNQINQIYHATLM